MESREMLDFDNLSLEDVLKRELLIFSNINKLKVVKGKKTSPW